MKTVSTSLFILLTSGFALNSLAWHLKGHEVIVECAMPIIRDSLPQFISRGTKLIAHCSGDPGLFKDRSMPQVRDEEYPNHFFDLEMLKGNSAPAVRSEYNAFCVQMGLRAERVGFLPYSVMEWTQRLTVVFAEYRKWPESEEIKTKCLVYAGILAHYAGDLEQPLHLTIHYDGMAGKNGVSPRSGIHDKVDALVEKTDCRGNSIAQKQELLIFKDLMTGIWEEIHFVHGLVPKVYSLEKKIPDTKKPLESDPELNAFAKERLRSSSLFLARLYLTAWVNSAKIEVPEWDIHGNK
jgi:hypothetical protein